jgi:hypothetical protein
MGDQDSLLVVLPGILLRLIAMPGRWHLVGREIVLS